MRKEVTKCILLCIFSIHVLAPTTFKGTGLVPSDIKVNEISAGDDT